MAKHLFEELTRAKQMVNCLSIAFYYQGFKLITNLIDREGGVIEHRISQLLARDLLDYLEIQVQLDGVENIDGLRHYCVISNHASYLDWAVLLGYFPSPLRFVAKRELLVIPVIGGYLRDRGIVIDRSRGRDALTAIQEAVEERQPWPILLFPEGTRSFDGKLRPFKLGGLKILADAGLPMVPVGIWGTFEAMPRQARTIKTRSRVRMAIGRPLDPAGYGDVAAVGAELSRRIESSRAGA